MSSGELSPIVVERVMERLRQERETFNQHRLHEDRWFLLRLVMGYASVLLLGGVMFISSYVLLNNKSFPVGVITAAGAALFVDVLGLLVGVWKIALNPNFLAKLGPVTRDDLPPATQDITVVGRHVSLGAGSAKRVGPTITASALSWKNLLGLGLRGEKKYVVERANASISENNAGPFWQLEGKDRVNHSVC